MLLLFKKKTMIFGLFARFPTFESSMNGELKYFFHFSQHLITNKHFILSGLAVNSTKNYIIKQG